MAQWISEVDRIVVLPNGASARFTAKVARPLTPQFEDQALADGCRKVEEEKPAAEAVVAKPKRTRAKKEAD